MTRPKTDPPSNWDIGAERVPDSPEPGVYVQKTGRTGDDVWVWHWHRPRGADVDGRWECRTTRLHTIVQLEPLTLDPSLGCDEGCPSHGWIKNGRWINA